MAEHLSGELVGGGAALGTAYYKMVVSNTVSQACTISGPPTVSFIDPAGSGFLVRVGAGSPCGTGPIDPSLCVDNQAIELAPAGQGSLAQVTVIVAIANALNFDPEPTPTHQAHMIVLKFPQASGVVIPLNQDVTLIPNGQVFLYGFGQLSTP
jgi:Protein of unknown function (DUF4232)